MKVALNHPTRPRACCISFLNTQVLTMHTIIHDAAPEIEKYIDEMPPLPADDSRTGVSPASLWAYAQALQAMLHHYRRTVFPIQPCAPVTART